MREPNEEFLTIISELPSDVKRDQELQRRHSLPIPIRPSLSTISLIWEIQIDWGMIRIFEQDVTIMSLELTASVVLVYSDI